jgi:hypothetical protein
MLARPHGVGGVEGRVYGVAITGPPLQYLNHFPNPHKPLYQCRGCSGTVRGIARPSPCVFDPCSLVFLSILFFLGEGRGV